MIKHTLNFWERVMELSNAEIKSIEDSIPSEENPICECAGMKICIWHRLADIFNRIIPREALDQGYRPREDGNMYRHDIGLEGL